MHFVSRVIRFLKKNDPDADYLEAHGFRHGENFVNYSPYAIDANWPFLISVGDDVLISSNVRILAHDASPVRGGEKTKIGIVTIGNNVFIGANSTVLCNVRIGSNVVIGAGSVVTRNIPDNSVAAGNPAKVLCTFDDYIQRHHEAKANHYVFTEHRWDEWINLGESEWEMMREKLKNGFGYV